MGFIKCHYWLDRMWIQMSVTNIYIVSLFNGVSVEFTLSVSVL